ncbi:cinnamoyl ester hydrolase [Salipaludibacillus neizhouensis]|uniref:Cinnamoyl ester hydrolase n=1 Tax=Salipaludibacillus neizhouensis TaxID=885475 RepID=A0A3A9K8W7_9BACI|nr:alpha/beta fold hydrolase [Salipaludibacillus neizhouensis]RKL67260.1 cinnamoyl ester hydrolase [Salipaludibacillus neizhouensis]
MKNYEKKEVKIKHNDREIYGVSYMPITSKNCPVVIFSHGFNGTNADFSMNSEYLAVNGVGAYCFDFCGGSVNSQSDLKTTEMSIFTEKEDLCTVIDTIKDWENVDRDNIFLFGGSQGGLVTALAAEEYIEKIKGILLLFPAFCIADNWNERFPKLDSIPDNYEFWGVTLGRVFIESIHGYNVFEHIGKFHKNVLIFHGDLDEIVPLEYGERAAKLYPHARIEVFSGEGHGFSEAGNKKVADMTFEFVKANA